MNLSIYIVYNDQLRFWWYEFTSKVDCVPFSNGLSIQHSRVGNSLSTNYEEWDSDVFNLLDFLNKSDLSLARTNMNG